MGKEQSLRVLEKIRRIPHEEFVLHGSPNRCKILLSRQPALIMPDQRFHRFHRKGVYATALPTVAVLYALLPFEPMWSYNRREKALKVRIPPEGITLECSGFIHVCARKGFTGNPLEYFAKGPVRVLRTFEVHPWAIKVVEEWDDIHYLPTLGVPS